MQSSQQINIRQVKKWIDIARRNCLSVTGIEKRGHSRCHIASNECAIQQHMSISATRLGDQSAGMTGSAIEETGPLPTMFRADRIERAPFCVIENARKQRQKTIRLGQFG